MFSKADLDVPLISAGRKAGDYSVHPNNDMLDGILMEIWQSLLTGKHNGNLERSPLLQIRLQYNNQRR
jgi:hypothetical protein